MSKFTEYLEAVKNVKIKVVKETVKVLEDRLEELFFDKLSKSKAKDETIDLLLELITQDDRYNSDKWSVNDLDESDMVSQAIKWLNKDKNRIKELISDLEKL